MTVDISRKIPVTQELIDRARHVIIRASEPFIGSRSEDTAEKEETAIRNTMATHFPDIPFNVTRSGDTMYITFGGG